MQIHDLVFDRVTSHGDAVALYRGDLAMTYSEFVRQIQSAAAGLRALGIDDGDRVAIYLNKRVEGVIAVFAASLADGVFVPVNPALKPAQVKHILNDCGVSVLVTSDAQAKLLAGELRDCPELRNLVVVDGRDLTTDATNEVEMVQWTELVADSSVRVASRRIDNDIAAIFYTSGSTGKPKGVVLSHRNIAMGAISVASYLENSSDDIILSALPLSFDAGFSQLTTAFRVGASVVLMDYLLPQDVPRTAARYSATALTGVPPLWNQLARLKWPDDAVKSLRYIANTGGAMPIATLEKLRALLPKTKVYLMYGLTESFRSTYLPPDELDERPTSMGKAIPNAEVMVVREDGTPCDPGEPGELVHRGALVSLGYWNDPERSAQRFKPVPNQRPELPFEELAVWSGDTVVKDEEGFLYFVGRRDDMIKSSGYRISPTEVEEVIYESGLVTECAALGISHPDIGQAVVIAASSESPGDESSKAIIDSCKRALPNFMVPALVVWLDKLHKNPNGKIDRKRLAGELGDLYAEDN